MLFNSLHFAVFFPVVTILYFLLPHKHRWWLLLGASAYFYMAFVPVYILILGVTIVVDYFAGILIEEAHAPQKKKLYLALSLIANIGFLAFFKYFNFLNSNISALAEFVGWNYPIDKRDQSKCLDILITDRDPNQRLTLRTIGINFDDASVSANPLTYVTKSATDTLKAQICFEKCVESRHNQPVIVEVIVADDGCPQPLLDTLRIRVFIEGALYNNPDVVTSLTNNRAAIAQGTTLNFSVIGSDKDNDELVLEARGRGFQLNQVGMTFNNATGKGTVTQPFTPSRLLFLPCCRYCPS